MRNFPNETLNICSSKYEISLRKPVETGLKSCTKFSYNRNLNESVRSFHYIYIYVQGRRKQILNGHAGGILGVVATNLEAVVSFQRAMEGLLPGKSGRKKVHYFET